MCGQHFTVAAGICKKVLQTHPFTLQPSKSSLDDVLETVNGVTGQPHPLTATAQVLAVRSLHVYVPLLLLTDAARLRAALRKQEIKNKKNA